MASVKNLSYGSTGEDVKKLQTALGFTGKDVDGIFGKKTQQAVKDYQKANGLTVDGIAGKNTQGKLYGSGSNKGNTGGNAGSQKPATGSGKAGAGNTGKPKETFTTPAGNTYESFTYDEFTYDPFQGSDTLNQAWDTLGQLQGNAPGAWTDPYRDQYMGYLNQYENRDPFSYDFNTDALYQQYKDQYIQQGQMAMMDTMGQAAAMTGGYGNSYAQTVGQQAYNQQLNQLNAIMPELYDRAYGIYQQEGQDLFNMYNAYLGLSEQDYNQYLGEVDNYYKQLGAASDYATNLYNKEYGEWSDKTKMDFDTWSANTGLSFDEWATQTGILSDENNTLMNQQFQQEENQKDRDFTANQNKLNNDAAIEAAAIKAANESNMNTEDTLTWLKQFKGATSIPELEQLTAGLAGVIGPEAAAEWFDLYAEALEDDDEDDNGICPICGKARSVCGGHSATGGGGGGPANKNYNMVM